MGTGPHTPPPPPSPGRGLMDKHELAAFLGLPVGTVTKMISRRKCPRITWIGRHARFDWPDVQAWLAEQKEKPATVKAAPVVELEPARGRRRAA